jgi:hypothetical protein
MTPVVTAASAFVALVTVPSTVPSTAPPATTVPPTNGTGSRGQFTSSVGEVIRDVIDNLGNNAYQTGVALVVATIAIVAMMNIRVHRLVLIPVGVGAFWFGWLGWNTVTADNNPLFPGDVSATKIWDVAFTSGTGFLVAVGVGCIAAIFLWRKGVGLGSRLVMLAGAVLGASFVYNLYEAIRVS